MVKAAQNRRLFKSEIDIEKMFGSGIREIGQNCYDNAMEHVDDFEEYTNHALDTAVAYSDAGKPLGTHKQCAKDSLLAALQHIKR